MVRHTALVGLAPMASFEFHLSNWLGPSGDQPVAPEATRLQAAETLCVRGTTEPRSLCPSLAPAHATVVTLPGDHHFGGDYATLARVLLEHAARRLNPRPEGRGIRGGWSTGRQCCAGRSISLPAICPSGSTSCTAAAAIASSRHAEDHAARLVLGEVEAARVAHLLHRARAVGTHAGEHDAQRVLADHLCRRAEQDLHRRLVAVDRVAVAHTGKVVRARSLDTQVQAARGDVGMARQHAFAVHGFLDADAAQAVEPRRIALGEAGRHVLGDHHRGENPAAGRGAPPWWPRCRRWTRR